MRVRALALFFCSLLLSVSAVAQPLSLPYTTTFDPTDDRLPWIEYRIGHKHNFSWNMNSIAPYSVTHDYPVGGVPEGEVVNDWFVSPPLQFLTSGVLSIRFNVFTIMGSTTPTDYFGIWFSDGDPDPAKGDYVEIINLTEVSSTGEWRDSSQIMIPYTADSGYVAVVYRAAENWFTVGVQEITVVPNSSSSVDTERLNLKQLNVYPNPSTSTTTFEIPSELNHRNLSLEIFSSYGERVWRGNFSDRKIVFSREEWPSGVYYYRLSNGEGVTEFGNILLQ